LRHPGRRPPRLERSHDADEAADNEAAGAEHARGAAGEGRQRARGRGVVVDGDG